MDRPSRGILGKRVQRIAHTGEGVEAGGSRASKRTRSRAKAYAVQQTSTPESEPWSTRLRSGLLTPETSNLSAEDALPDMAPDDNPANAFPFMKLPAELRINIYNKALVRDEPLLLHAQRAPDKADQDSTLTNSGSAPWPRPQTPSHARPTPRAPSAAPERNSLHDPVSPQLLRVNTVIYKEARQVFYSDNVFTLSLLSGIHTLSSLHQRSRSLIKHVTLTIPSHHDILDGFADLVRLGLRYCWGLKSFKIVLQASLPDDGRVSGAASVYANAFHILRWLPRGCSVVLEGNVSESVRKVVEEEGRLQGVLDETSYLKRQHQMPERH
ncbi:hypothetical protein NX059_007972 [Plenodomus lindquistii]|nr:hypothetical protein NX059_007972 [Plenodomus lindquistii]